MSGPVAELASRLRAARRSVLAPSWRALAVGVVLLALFAAAHLARLGTPKARVGAAALLAGVALSLIGLAVIERRRWRDARRSVQRVVSEDDPKLGAALDRAAGLAGSEPAARGVADKSPARDPLTERFAALHLSRKIAEVEVDRIADRAGARGRSVAFAAFGVSAAALALAAVDPFRVIEGLDVLASKEGAAPVELVYLDEIDIVAVPPSYVGMHDEALGGFGRTEQPRGTVLTVRGKPQRAGRDLILTDGTNDFPFVPDGNGMLLARYTLGETTRLRIASRFGGVRVYQKDTLAVESIPDQAPQVELQGAPKTVKLVDTPSVSLEYEATDDHGLREIALVLRARGKEERRTLSKPTGKVERGANELSTREPFIRSSYVPVEVTIEAKDNDEVLGPKWGKSAAFIIVPPLVGEPEALRYLALVRARDALVDLVAARVTADLTDPKARVPVERDLQKKALDVVEDVLSQTYGGLRVNGRARRIVAGQLRRLRDALAAFEKKPSADEYKSLVEQTENVTLAVDAAIRTLGAEDARKVSKRLADVADEAAAACRAAADPVEADRSPLRLKAALDVLAGGGDKLAVLGDLGADLGDIARGGVGRIGRERDRHDLRLAELAALDLADRLRNPYSSVGGGGRPGVESGVGDGGGTDDGDASEAGAEADQGSKELDELIQRHKEEMERVEDAIDKATTAEERDALRKLAKEQAAELRDAVKDLPEGGVPGSSAQKAAEARKRVESMAGSLEKGDVKEAIEAGKEAVESLREAEKRASQDLYDEDQEIKDASKQARNRVEESLESLENRLEQMKKQAKERASKDLGDAGDNEGRLAEKSKDLARRGRAGDASMPDEMLDKLGDAEKAMRDAEKALKEGDSDKGREKQEEAQRLLEMAKGEDDEQDGKGKQKGRDDGDGQEFDQDTEVPGADQHKSPDEFRKRVLDGLGKPSDARLREAVKRYAEGLLK
ncbi:MAG TPA: DUF4175 family protein [Polyangiaceae bacterium]|nr:DUF4175 family protein [Polyangiaceae bacterium]